MAGHGEPALDQRARRRHDEIRRPDAQRENDEDCQGRRKAVRERDSAKGDRQDDQRQKHHDRMHGRLLARPEATEAQVRIAVPGQQRTLEEEHRGCPDLGRATEGRKQCFRDHRLDHEDECGSDERRCREENHHGREVWPNG